MRILYDETHNQTWTADPLLALAMSRRSNEAPRYYSYAHVADLVRSVLAGEHRRLTQWADHRRAPEGRRHPLPQPLLLVPAFARGCRRRGLLHP